DPALLETMRVEGRLPRLAIVVTVREAFLHCAKAFRRSRLWDPAQQRDRRELPSLSRMILDQTTAAPGDEEMERIDADLEEEYKRAMDQGPGGSVGLAPERDEPFACTLPLPAARYCRGPAGGRVHLAASCIRRCHRLLIGMDPLHLRTGGPQRLNAGL